MKVLACDVDWVPSSGSFSCPGTLHNIEAASIPTGITVEDAQILVGHAIELFAVVAAALLVRKALK